MLHVLSILALLLGLFTAPLRAQPQDGPPVKTAEDKVEEVKEFQRQFRKFKLEAEQVEAVLSLKGNECVPAAEELLKLLKHPNGGVQQAALTVLESYSDQATFQHWIDGLPLTKDAEQQAMLCKILGRAKVKAAAPAVTKLLVEGRTMGFVKVEALRALIRVGDANSSPAVAPMLKDPDALVRMVAADAVGELRLAGLGEALVPLFNDSEWQVQTAAITAAGFVRPIQAIQPLIDLMRKGGRLQTECADALFKITTLDFGVDPDQWQKQWERLKDLGYKVPTEEELKKKAEARKKSDAFYGKADKQTTFAGIPTTSTKLLFIIDVSGSMDELVVERDKFQGYRDLKKLTIVKKQLRETVDSLGPDTWFDICAFASDLHPWKKRLVQATVVNREAARSWIDRLEPIGGGDAQDLAMSGLGGAANLSAGKTNTLKALLYMFGIDPENPPKPAVITGSADRRVVQNKIDTVYFLSDGRPSIGKLVDTQEIRKEVRHWNGMYRMVLHCISIGEFEKDFMKELASENGGVFVDLGR